MTDKLAQDAICAALNNEWEEACRLNKQILKIKPQDVTALVRLARANFELGKLKKARSFAKKALKLDPLNKIATKCLDRWDGLCDEDLSVQESIQLRKSANQFLEEPGKTKIVYLINLGDSRLLASINCGEIVRLSARHHKVSIKTHSDGKYIGRLPDDLAKRLIRLIRAGNQYKVLIKSISRDSVKIFIRETVCVDRDSSFTLGF